MRHPMHCSLVVLDYRHSAASLCIFHSCGLHLLSFFLVLVRTSFSDGLPWFFLFCILVLCVLQQCDRKRFGVYSNHVGQGK